MERPVVFHQMRNALEQGTHAERTPTHTRTSVHYKRVQKRKGF